MTWAPIDPDATWAVLVWDDDLLVTMAAVTERDVLVGELRTHVACIRGMRTRPDHRRRGFASSAMNRAMQFVWKELRPEMALLLSSEMAVPFYEGLGCRILPGPVLCEQPNGKVEFSELLPALDQLQLLDRLPELPQPELRTLFDSLRLQVAFQPAEAAVDVEVALFADEPSDRRKEVAEVQSVPLIGQYSNPDIQGQMDRIHRLLMGSSEQVSRAMGTKPGQRERQVRRGPVPCS